MLSRAVRSFWLFSSDIKLAHSVFALPFVAVGLLLSKVEEVSGFILMVLLACMFCARSFAMGMNRFIDRRIDLANPRTSQRLIASGKLPAGQGLLWSLSFAVCFVALCFYFLNPLAAYCSVPLLFILAMYSFMKRWTFFCHWYLGLCLGLAPLASEIAVTGDFSWSVLCLGLAVCLWTGGFDILYAMQDIEFDRHCLLHSVPANTGF